MVSRSVRVVLVVLALAGAVGMAGCGAKKAPSSGNAQPDNGNEIKLIDASAQSQGQTGDGTVRVPASPSAGGGAPTPDANGELASLPPDPSKWVQVSANKAVLGVVLTEVHGFTLYQFDKDGAGPARSACSGDCARTWPPVTIQPGGTVYVDGVDRRLIGAFKREDGTAQLTIAGRPAYRFAKDVVPGDLNGQGVGGTWFVIGKDGKKNTTPVRGAAAPPEEAADTTTLTGMTTGYGFVVVDQTGATVYRRIQDGNNPPAARCAGACAQQWKPVVAPPGSNVKVSGVDPAKVGTYKRSDGKIQLTWQGWPLYRNGADRSLGTVMPGCGTQGWIAVK